MGLFDKQKKKKEGKDMNIQYGREEVIIEFLTIPGITPIQAALLYDAGYRSLEVLKEAEVEDFTLINGISLEDAKRIKEGLGKEQDEPEKKLRLAKNYEEALRIDDALKIYRELGLKNDIKRIRLAQAKELENIIRYEDAAKIYEELDMWEEAGEVRKLEKKREELKAKLPPEKLLHAQKLEKALRYEDAAKLYEELDMWEDAGRVRKLEKEEQVPQMKVDIGEIDRSVSISDSVVQRSTIGETRESLSNCPFCGKKFSFKKTPKFCPFCNEELG